MLTEQLAGSQHKEEQTSEVMAVSKIAVFSVSDAVMLIDPGKQLPLAVPVEAVFAMPFTINASQYVRGKGCSSHRVYVYRQRGTFEV